jgi:hypothetical protein
VPESLLTIHDSWEWTPEETESVIEDVTEDVTEKIIEPQIEVNNNKRLSYTNRGGGSKSVNIQRI